eukprot:scaffold7679_cov403-Prasinococcus_capsulatus_cf.AAC.11
MKRNLHRAFGRSKLNGLEEGTSQDRTSREAPGHTGWIVLLDVWEAELRSVVGRLPRFAFFGRGTERLRSALSRLVGLAVLAALAGSNPSPRE